MTSDEGSEEKNDEKLVQAITEERGKEFRLFEDEKYYIDEYVALLILMQISTRIPSTFSSFHMNKN
jgi:hypothetical protein